MLFSIVCNVAV